MWQEMKRTKDYSQCLPPTDAHTTRILMIIKCPLTFVSDFMECLTRMGIINSLVTISLTCITNSGRLIT